MEKGKVNFENEFLKALKAYDPIVEENEVFFAAIETFGEHLRDTIYLEFQEEVRHLETKLKLAETKLRAIKEITL